MLVTLALLLQGCKAALQLPQVPRRVRVRRLTFGTRSCSLAAQSS